MLSIVTSTLVFSALLLPSPAEFAAQYCASDEQPVCIRMHVSSIGENKIDVEAFDRTNNEFMRTRWVAPGVMARTMWADGEQTCVLMYRDERGRLVEHEDADACL